MLLASTSAKAASITYTFSGAGFIEGTDFTYVTADGYLSFPTGILTPTSAGHLVAGTGDHGPLTGFNFISQTAFSLHSQTLTDTYDFTFEYVSNVALRITGLENGELFYLLNSPTAGVTGYLISAPTNFNVINFGSLGPGNLDGDR